MYEECMRTISIHFFLAGKFPLLQKADASISPNDSFMLAMEMLTSLIGHFFTVAFLSRPTRSRVPFDVRNKSSTERNGERRLSLPRWRMRSSASYRLVRH